MSFQHINSPSFTAARQLLNHLMKIHGELVSVESWQGRDVRGKPDMRTHELLNVTLRVPLNGGYDTSPMPVSTLMSLPYWRQDIRPNLPWADEHFEERIGGVPLNPAPSWERWPWAKSAAGFCKGVFDHTYPERFWPKYAEATPGEGLDWRDRPRKGIRFPYGDLMDVVRLLLREPHTRQAYLPIFFPEDTSPEAKRKPCTIGYQFIVRDYKLHCFYPMRSCDLIRHWADDAYLAVRLVLWIIETCRKIEEETEDAMNVRWLNTTPGSLTMHMTSLHVFANDLRSM